MSENDTNESTQTPDIDRSESDDWATRPFPLDSESRRNAIRVVFKQSVLNDIHTHGHTRTDVEICGVMIGNGYRDEHGPYVYIEGNIRGKHAEGQTAQVTFTGETWNYIHNELDQNYPELRILGWYHTHPGFGIFLSGMDMFIHENYFNANEQLALVYDPLGGDEGLFVWRQGKALRDGFLIEPDVPEDPVIGSREPRSENSLVASATESRSTGAESDLSSRVKRIERRQTLVALGLIFAMLLGVIGPVVSVFLYLSPGLLDDLRTTRPSPMHPEIVEPQTENEPEEENSVIPRLPEKPSDSPESKKEKTNNKPAETVDDPPAADPS